MSGYVKTHRSIFSHDLFAGDEFSRRDAWLWLIANAAWKPHRVRHKCSMIEIGRGQLPGSRKHLASVWGWGEQRVRTFLAQLLNEGMITAASNQQLTIITICNYAKFQHIGEEANQQITSNQPATNHTEEGKTLREEDTTLTHAKPIEPEPVRKPLTDQSKLEAMTDALTKAAGKALNPTSPNLMMIADPLNWIQAGADFDLDILPAVALAAQKCRPGSIHGWYYFAGPVKDAMHRRIETGKSFAEAPTRTERPGKYDPPSDAVVLAAMTRQPLPPKLTPAMD